MRRLVVRSQLAARRAVDVQPDRTVWIVVGIAFVLRLVWVMWAHRPAEVGDPASYVFYGDQLSRGNGYRSYPATIDEMVGTTDFGRIPPTAFYAIGYPLFLALLFLPARLVGIEGSYDNYAVVYGLAHAVLGALTVYLVARIARRIGGARVAVIAAVVVAFWPNLVMLTATAHVETLYLFLVAAAVLVLLPAVQEPGRVSIGRLVAGGAILGAAAEVRPLVALIVPGVLLAFRARPLPWAAAARHTAVVTGTMLALVVPWTIRNAIEMPGFVLVTTGSGDAFCMSRYEGATGTFEINSPGCLNDVPGEPWDVKEVTKNRENTARALRWIVHHPVSEVRLVFWRGFYGFRDDHEARIALEASDPDTGEYTDPLWDERERALADLVADLWYFGALALAGVGVSALWRRDRAAARLLVLGAIGAAVVVPFLLFGDPRYKVPMHPFVAVVAAFGVERIWTRAGPTRAPGQAV